MKFGPVPVADAEGAILAHAAIAGPKRLKKGHLIGADDVSALREAGVAEVIVARLTPDDLDEDAAASALAGALLTRNATPKRPATGRVNIHAEAAGVLRVDRSLVDRVNRVDPAITLATLAENACVEAGQMVATVKIIPFAAARASVEAVTALLAEREIFAVEPFTPHRVALIQTTLPTVKASVLDKTKGITQARLARSGSRIVSETRTGHDEAELAAAISRVAPDCDIVAIFGASAVSDFDDVIPAAIRRAGGHVERVGMPVDPGNLLVLGDVDGRKVLGAPGCARSPKENGFDWVLDRLVAGMDVTADDIAGMGVGGLLMEIATRPQPRELPARPSKSSVHAVVLAAGRSSRMGGPNKLLARFDGEPLLRRTVERVLEAEPAGVTVVTGHQDQRAAAVLDGLPVTLRHNPDFAEGLSTSLRTGISAVPEQAAGAMIVLADMPGAEAADFRRLIAAFRAGSGDAVVRATHGGKRGNPVILPRALFGAVEALKGDTGARAIVEGADLPVIDVEIGSAASVDVDTPEAMRSAGGVLQE